MANPVDPQNLISRWAEHLDDLLQQGAIDRDAHYRMGRNLGRMVRDEITKGGPEEDAAPVPYDYVPVSAAAAPPSSLGSNPQAPDRHPQAPDRLDPPPEAIDFMPSIADWLRQAGMRIVLEPLR